MWKIAKKEVIIKDAAKQFWLENMFVHIEASLEGKPQYPKNQNFFALWEQYMVWNLVSIYVWWMQWSNDYA